MTKKTIRDDNTSGNTNWTYCFVFEVILHHVVTQYLINLLYCQEESICGGAINGVTIEACLNSSCTSTNGTLNMLSNGERRVMATFTDLMENRKYTATLYINYNGGVVQQSQPVDNQPVDSECDCQNATVIAPSLQAHLMYTMLH